MRSDQGCCQTKFPDQVFAWDNLLLACGRCNGAEAPRKAAPAPPPVPPESRLPRTCGPSPIEPRSAPSTSPPTTACLELAVRAPSNGPARTSRWYRFSSKGSTVLAPLTASLASSCVGSPCPMPKRSRLYGNGTPDADHLGPTRSCLWRATLPTAPGSRASEWEAPSGACRARLLPFAPLST